MNNFDINSEKIDLVYLWVDDNDQKWQEKKSLWQQKLNIIDNIENSTSKCRFRNNDELKYSLRSVEKFAPWINKIFIVTDNQIPNWLDTSNPKIEVIFHQDFIEQKYLPCFNSIALEFHLHKIPNLSEYFLLANDDMFFGRKVKKQDFYTKSGKIIERTNRLNYSKEQIADASNFMDTIPVEFNKCIFWTNAVVYNKLNFIPNYIDIHNITAYKKSLIKECCEVFKEEVEKVCSQKFRNGHCIERLIYSYYAYYKKELERKEVYNNQTQKKMLERSKFNPKSWFQKFEYITLHMGKIYSPFSPECILEKRPKFFCANDTNNTKERHRELFKKMITEYFPQPSSYEKQEQINICLATDDNYIPHCAATILSIIKNATSNSYLNFFILNKGLLEENIQKIRTIANTQNSKVIFKQVNNADFKNCPVPKHMHFSIETYFRIKIASLFPAIDKMLYIDCDTIILSDIKTLWETDIKEHCVAVCKDLNIQFSHLTPLIGEHIYFNAGIMLINCKKWREENIEEKCFDFINKHSDYIIWVDQDVLNCVLLKKLRFFSETWNFQYHPAYDTLSYLYKDKELNLIHYISKNKPWKTNVKCKYAKYYYKYAFKTPWKAKALKNYIENVIFNKVAILRTFMEDKRVAKSLIKEVHNRRVVLWGASIYLKNLIKYHNIKTSEIVGIIDRDPGKTGKKLGKYMIYHPNSLDSLKPDIIISSVVNHPKMGEFINEELTQRKLDIEVNTQIFVK